jgi:hypothetical protein
MTPAQLRLVAAKGTYIVNNTTEVTRPIASIVVLENTVFTSIKSNDIDIKANYIATPATAVKAGAIIAPQDGEDFTGVKLASGSVALVLG